MEKKIEYNCITGPASKVIESLERSLSQYLRHYRDVKVGITGREPQKRFIEHLNEDPKWERMVVKYKSSSENFVNSIEKYFIYTRPKLKNIWIGTSHLYPDGQNYLYFILKGKKR